jgi:hypothetical protein
VLQRSGGAGSTPHRGRTAAISEIDQQARQGAIAIVGHFEFEKGARRSSATSQEGG